MKKLLISLLVTLLAFTSCAISQYSTVSDSYYTVEVYEGRTLLHSYSPCRIISRDGLRGGLTYVTLEVGGSIISVVGSTILVYEIYHPSSIYLLYGRSYYRWYDRFDRFIYRPIPPRHQAPPPPPLERRYEPRQRPDNRVQQPRREETRPQQPAPRNEQPRRESQPQVTRPSQPRSSNPAPSRSVTPSQPQRGSSGRGR